MNTFRRWLSVTVTAAMAAACLCACGSSEDPAPEGAVPSGQAAQQTLGAAGGDVVLASSDGAVFTLSLPAGALGDNTTVSLSTASATAAQHFHLRLAPEGLVLAAGKVATLTIALRSSAALPARGGLLYDGVPVPFTRLSDGRLRVQLTHFAGTATAAGSGRSQTLSLRAQAAASASAATCSPQLGGADGGMTANDAVEIELYGQCMVAAVNALAQNGQYAAAVRLASATAAYLQAAGAGDAGGFVAQASGIACVAYRDALNTALATPVTTMGTLYTVLKPVLFWEGVRQGFGATCAGVGTTAFIDVTNTKTSEAAAFYASKKGSITDTTGTEYTEAVREAQAGQTSITQVRSLQPSPAVDALLTSAVEQRAQPSLLDAMLQAPWQRCRDSNDYAELARLLALMDGAQSIKDAIQHCATQITGRAKNGSGAVTATLNPALGGVSASQHLRLGSLRVDRGGRVVIDGTIGTLACPEGDSETLEVTFKGVVVATLPSSGRLLLGASRPLAEFDPAALLQAAGLPATDSGSYPLALRRKGSACATAFGIADDLLATVMLDFGLLTVTVTDADSECIESPFTVPRYLAATDKTLPLRLAGNPCPGHGLSMRLDLADSNTVVFANDFVSTHAPGPGLFVSHDRIAFGIRAAQAGTLTLSLNRQWVESAAACRTDDYSYALYAYVYVNGVIQFVGRNVPGIRRCYGSADPPYMPTTASVPVAAGQEVRFEVGMEDQARDLTGRGTVMTVRFEPAR